MTNRNPCPTCGGEVPSAAGARVRIYCSQPCRQFAKDARKMERYRRDPAYRRRVRTRQQEAARRAGAQPLLDPNERACEHCGESYQGARTRKFCSVQCRRRSAYKRERLCVRDEVSALVKNYNEAGDFIEPHRPTLIECRSSSSFIIPFCPTCNGIMRLIPNDLGMDLRDCGTCRLRASLNAEEVSWLIYCASISGPSRQTAS